MSSRPLPDELLLAFAGGELSPDEARRVEQALVHDATARRRVERYRQVAGATAADDTVAPPADVVARAKAIFSRRPAEAGASWRDVVPTIVARLIYDSRLRTAALRDPGLRTRFDLTFDADGVELDLQAERILIDEDADGAPRWRVIGQVSAEPDPGVVDVAVLASGRRDAPHTVRSDERSVFTLDLDAGTYDLTVRCGERAIGVRGIEIR